MFNFTTQTIFNSIKKSEVGAGVKPAKDANLLVSSTDKPEVRIGNTRFNKANVLDIQMKNATEENLASVTFDISKVLEIATAEEGSTQAGTYRVVLYIGLSMNSQDSFYANDFVYKGKPLYIEFAVKNGESAAAIAKKMVNIANKYLLFTAQEKILDISADGNNITFAGVNGYQQIKKAVFQKFDPEASPIDCCNSNGDYVDLVVGVPVVWTADENGVVTTKDKVLDEGGELRDLADDEVAIAPGIEAFCDYNWIIHNLRLPTLANTYFWAVNKSEMPVVGGKYVQFIIRLIAERDGIGGEVVGQRATSVTNHVLYVLDQGQNVNIVKTELAKLVDAIKTDADDKMKNPFNIDSNSQEEDDDDNG